MTEIPEYIKWEKSVLQSKAADQGTRSREKRLFTLSEGEDKDKGKAVWGSVFMSVCFYPCALSVDCA